MNDVFPGKRCFSDEGFHNLCRVQFFQAWGERLVIISG